MKKNAAKNSAGWWGIPLGLGLGLGWVALAGYTMVNSFSVDDNKSK